METVWLGEVTILGYEAVSGKRLTYAGLTA